VTANCSKTELSDTLTIVILPVLPLVTDSLNVMTMLALVATLSALSAGVVEAMAGGAPLPPLLLPWTKSCRWRRSRPPRHRHPGHDRNRHKEVAAVLSGSVSPAKGGPTALRW